MLTLISMFGLIKSSLISWFTRRKCVLFHMCREGGSEWCSKQIWSLSWDKLGLDYFCFNKMILSNLYIDW